MIINGGRKIYVRLPQYDCLE